jgi:tRNA(Ile)-lysidine synthase
VSLATTARRALQPLWNALDDIAPACVDGAVLAVSGGPDSRALLESVARWRHRPTKLLVVAVDHGLRPAARSEVAAVVDRATGLGLLARSIALRGLKPDEHSLRQARHQALADAAREGGLGAVVYAHHRGDVAEGLLLHLAGQGGGRRGMALRPIERIDGLARARPFVALPKATLAAALAALGITDAVIDEDDRAGRNARARLRAQMAAAFGADAPGLEASLARHAQLLREDEEVIEALVPTGETAAAELPPAILRRWLRRQIARLSADPRTSPSALDAVIRIAAGTGTGSVAVAGGTVWIRATPEGRRLAVEPAHGQSPQTA